MRYSQCLQVRKLFGYALVQTMRWFQPHPVEPITVALRAAMLTLSNVANFTLFCWSKTLSMVECMWLRSWA